MELGIRKMHPFVVSSIYYYVSIILNWGFFAALDVKTKQLCDNTHLQKISMFHSGLEFMYRIWNLLLL